MSNQFHLFEKDLPEFSILHSISKCQSEVVLPFGTSYETFFEYLCTQKLLQSRVIIKLSLCLNIREMQFSWVADDFFRFFYFSRPLFSSIILQPLLNKLKMSETNWRDTYWHIVHFQPWRADIIYYNLIYGESLSGNFHSEALKTRNNRIHVRFSGKWQN